ncbi:hypothetical protein B0A78_03265 [Flavobacterium columnare NBRC 100251 = ATCC 23463]|uniref:3-hydroxymyristoyl/3-hydroxydecanoyl-(Acyl carrier protein) dehydratase n=1 Tax=Flavobacterium columnare TaxID=996 RepID=A0AAI8CIU7_9FLAO|nr:hypothetical protein [Flavobacterium columnare]AMO20972.1 hypothetical protein UN65_12080 [Flavobacterium columnare]ANO47514.1 flexirubin-type pigment biosynthesis acyl carrier protein DarC1 [Flavobacterium columnare]APT21850.1 hypothetical protein BU993_03880 [Flavobacterium columnare]AUX18971.1 FabZ [Flavobacterium columnare]MEB3801997.1 hypothetical protein [Flavobacterium columnare]
MTVAQFPILDKKIVENLIPQKFPFVMIDQLIAYEEGSVIAGLTVTVDNIFTSNAIFQESGLIEHMAQSVAIYTGYQYFLKKEPVPTGYIGSINGINIIKLPEINDQITTQVVVLQEFMGVTLVEINSSVNGKIIATGKMKTVIAGSNE